MSGRKLTTVLLLLIALVPISAGGGVINTMLNSVLTKAVMAEEVGATLGLSTAVESGTRAIAPALGGVLLSQFGVWGPAFFCAILMVWVTALVWRRFVNGAALKLASDGMQSTEPAPATFDIES